MLTKHSISIPKVIRVAAALMVCICGSFSLAVRVLPSNEYECTPSI